jgi:hypothetical protein
VSGGRTTYEVNTSGCAAVIALLFFGTVATMAAFYGLASLVIWVVL